MIDEKALNNFKQTLNGLTDEPNWRAAKGEAIEDVVLQAQESTPTEENGLASEIFVAPEAFSTNVAGDDFRVVEDSVEVEELSAVEEEPSISSNEESVKDVSDQDFAGSENSVSEAELMSDSPDGVKNKPEEVNFDDLDMDFDSLVDDPGLNDLEDENEIESLETIMDLEDDSKINESDDLPDMDTPMSMDDDLPSMTDGLSGADDLDDSRADENSIDESSEVEFDLEDFGDVAPVTRQHKLVVQEEEEEFNEDDFVFTQHKINKINDNLAKLPRNLRLALQDILASESTSPLVIRDLTDKLLRTPSARGLASDVRDITGETIVVPRFYESHTGEAYEKRKATFSYNFSHLAWPKLRRLFASLILLATLFVTLFTFVYRPFTAQRYYSAGYEQILIGEYEEAMRYFEVAFDGWRLGALNVAGWPMQRWFFRYADAFVAQRQYAMAQRMYSLLMVAYPQSRQAFVAYGEFEGRVRANFERADQIYFAFLNNFNSQDYPVLTARAENLLAWGEVEPLRLHEARDVLAIITSISEPTYRTMSNWLRLAIMTDNAREIDRWVNLMRTKRNFEIDPVIMSQAAGWYIDNGRVDDAERLLQFIATSGAAVPELFYQYARYFELQGDLFGERDALDKALFLVHNSTPFTRQQTEMFISIFRRSGALRFAENMVDERAQQELERAAALYENAVDRRILARQGRYGAIYKEIGDLFYIRDRAFVAAGINYRRALANFYDTPDLRYKQGYIFYDSGDYEQSLANFYEAYNSLPEAKNILYSLGTVMYKRGNLFGAQDMYDELRRSLEGEREALLASNTITAEVSRRAVGEYLMKTYNNLGVVLHYTQGRNMSDGRGAVQAEVAFLRAVSLWDALSRDPESRARVISQELPGMNLREMLHPVPESRLEIYDSLPPFLDRAPIEWGF
jgi:tetratricopeptide (TPR) repeat protein